MNKLICLLLVSLSLAGCFEKPEVLSTSVVVMEVVNVNLRSKRNSTVDLKVVGTGIVYRGERLRCPRSDASNVKISSKWDVHVQEFKQGDRYGTELLGVDAICDLSQ